MKCPNCGEIIKEKKLNFCGFCGSNLKTGEKTLTAPIHNDSFSNNVPDTDAAEKIKSFSNPAPVNTPLPVNNNYASPFEQMVKENAAAQGFGGFQTVAPPSFEPSAVNPPPIVPDFNPKPEVTPTIVAPQPFNQYSQQFTEPPAPVNVQESIPQPSPAPASVSPIASFNPASLSAFDPYAHTEPVMNTADIPEIKPQEPSGSLSFTDMHSELKALAESEPFSSQSAAPVIPEPPVAPVAPAVEPVQPVIPAAEIPSEPVREAEPAAPQIEAISRRNPFEPGINLSKNVKIRNASDDPENNSITYMEYTRHADDDNKDSLADNKYSAFSFAPTPAAPAASEPVKEKIKTETAEPEKTVDEHRKEEARKVLDESVDSILNFASQKTSINLTKTAAEEAAPAAVISPEPVTEAESAAAPEPPAEPEPAPEPVVIKEKVINYVGQEKKAAEQMISFKGLTAEIEYVEDEKEFDFVIAQSIPADTEVLPGTVIKLTVSAGTWTDWEENPIPAPESKYITETKTEYRRRNRTRTTDKRDTTDSSEYPDYTLTGTDARYTDWEVDQYYTSEAVPPGDTCEIVRVTNGFKYAGWFNPANMSGMSFSSPDVANFFNTNLTGVKWTYEEIVSEQNIKPDVKNWKLVTDDMNSTPAGDPMISNIFFSAHVVDGKSYAMKFGSAETEWYIYKRRSLIETVYHFEKEIVSDWNEWTEWSEAEQTASEDCQVETRTLSRSKRKIPNA